MQPFPEPSNYHLIYQPDGYAGAALMTFSIPSKGAPCCGAARLRCMVACISASSQNDMSVPGNTWVHDRETPEQGWMLQHVKNAPPLGRRALGRRPWRTSKGNEPGCRLLPALECCHAARCCKTRSRWNCTMQSKRHQGWNCQSEWWLVRSAEVMVHCLSKWHEYTQPVLSTGFLLHEGDSKKDEQRQACKTLSHAGVLLRK